MVHIKLTDSRLFLLFFVAILTACSPKQSEPPKIAESQREALDQAKGLSDAVIQHADEQKMTLDTET